MLKTPAKEEDNLGIIFHLSHKQACCAFLDQSTQHIFSGGNYEKHPEFFLFLLLTWRYSIYVKTIDILHIQNEF